MYACQNNTSTQKTIKISGAFALYPLVQKWTQEYTKLHPEITFDVQAGGAGKGLSDVLSGMVDIGMFSREISNEEKKQGLWWITLCKEAVLPTVNAENPYIRDILEKGLTKEQFQSVFLNEQPLTWDSLLEVKDSASAQINIYTREDASGASESWAAYLGQKQGALKGKRVYGDSGIVDVLKKDKNAIGYNNSVFVFDSYTGEKFPGLEVIPIDINGNGKIDKEENIYGDMITFREALYSSKFPSPPGRDLFFITHERPQQQEVLDFFTWILAEGQKFIEPAGYVSLDAGILKIQLQKILEEIRYE